MKCRYEVSIKKKERKNLSTRLFHFAIGRLVSNLIYCLRVIKYSDLKVKYINKSIFKCQEYTPHVKRFKLNRRAFLVEGVNLKGEVEFVYPELPAALENYPEEVWLGTNKYYRHAASNSLKTNLIFGSNTFMILLKAVSVVYDNILSPHAFTVENEFLGGRLMEINDGDEDLLKQSQLFKAESQPVHGYFIMAVCYSDQKPSDKPSRCTLF